MPDEEALTVVVRVDEPTSDVGTSNLTGSRVVVWIKGEATDNEHIEADTLHRLFRSFLHLLPPYGAVFGPD